MLGKAFKYKGFDFTDWAQAEIVLQASQRPIALRTQVFDKANFHGTYLGATLAWGRLFEFDWQVFWETKAKRWIWRKKLIDVIQPDHNPSSINRGLYDLERLTDGWLAMTTKARVYAWLRDEHKIDDPIIDFSFSLYSENEAVFSPTVKTATWGIGIFAGIPLWTPFATPISWYGGYVTCENEGNRPTPIYVVVNWECDNPQLINLTNWYAYRIWSVDSPYTTNLLEYDNRNLNNDPTKVLVVNDLGNSIKAQRSQGGGIFLSPWENQFILLTDNDNPDVTMDIYRRDAYYLT